MLTVTVELNPWWRTGPEDDKVLAEMTIYNTGERETVPGRCNYVCIVHDMRDGKKEKRVGAVEGHWRDQDVWVLVQKCLNDMYPQ